MKANEIEDGKVLMIGDLVIGCIETDIIGEATCKIPCKVADINHYGDVSCEALKPIPDELDWQDGDDFSWIEPIPLTAEILEKNGFTRFGTDYILEGEHFGLDNPSNPNNYLDNYWLRISIKAVHIEYVHELQHAMRLCKIDKEITL